MNRRPGEGGGAERQVRIEWDIPSPSAPAPQATCAASGRPAPDLELRPFLRRLALICGECCLCFALDRAARRARP
jgi:hypothetical protein